MGNMNWKTGALTAAVMTGLMGFAAHAQDDMSKQDKEMKEQGKAVGEAAAKRQKYVGKLALFNNRQIQLAQVAEEQASDPRVKEFATKLRTDHENNNQTLRTWAENQKMTISALTDGSTSAEGVGGSGAQQGYNKGMENVGEKLGKNIDQTSEEVNKLRAKQGPEFDKAFLSRIAEDQKKGNEILKEGRKEYKNDATFLAILSKSEGVVSGHEKEAKELEKQIKK